MGKIFFAKLLFMGLGVLLVTAFFANAGTIEILSVSSEGESGNGRSSLYRAPAVSADGRFVAFGSEANNLVPGDTNGTGDVFVRDRQAGLTKMVSVSSSGVQGNFSSGNPSISSDGRYIAFASNSNNLVPGIPQTGSEIYLHDLATDKTEHISNTMDGKYYYFGSGWDPDISGNGRFVTFFTYARNLAPDGNYNPDVFMKDRLSGKTEKISVTWDGQEADGSGKFPVTNYDGRFVVFISGSSHLVPDDTNNVDDIFVRDRELKITKRVSIGSDGRQSNGQSAQATISSDGRFVAFISSATNLAPTTSTGFNVFVHDLETGKTESVPHFTDGRIPSSYNDPTLSEDGRFVAYSRGYVFKYDRETGISECISSDDGECIPACANPSLTANGKMVAFRSYTDNLVETDQNGMLDIFFYISALPQIEVAPTSLDFGSVEIATSTQKPIFISNAGTDDLNIASVALTGQDAGEYQIVSDCNVVYPNGACTVDVVFSPGSLGEKQATLLIVSDDPKQPTMEIPLNAVAVDSTAPVIQLNGSPEIYLEVGSSFVDVGATAFDNYDGDLTSAIVTANFVNTAMFGSYQVAYNVVDFSGNQASEVIRVVHVVDTTPPVISLTGEALVTVEAGTPYVDAGATAFDNYDGDLTNDIFTSNPVDTSAVGSYLVTYNVVDTFGNEAAEVSRLVNVRDTVAPVINITENLALLWPPNHKMVEVFVEGGATDSGAGIASVEIRVQDEYGQYNMLVPGFGSSIYLEASRKGQDKDGRLYTLTVSATDKSGNVSTATAQIIVPHDMGNVSDVENN